MKKWIPHNAFVKFLPLLVIYISIVVFFSKEEMKGDEGRYMYYAENLTKGFYSPSPPDVYLKNGPGYPLVLAPFAWLSAPLLLAKLTNAFFLYFAVVFIYFSLRTYLPSDKSFLYSLIAGLYWPPFQLLPRLYSESLTIMLISAIAFTLITAYRSEQSRYLVLCAIAIAYLAMTKVIFGYAIAMTLVLCLLIYFIFNIRVVRKMIYILAFSMVFCLPYLVYTYTLTGKVFYWASAMGSPLYFMSSPYPGEYGEWYGLILIDREEWIKKGLVVEDYDVFMANHGNIMEEAARLRDEESEKLFFQAALKNIRKHPEHYVQNWFTNFARMLLSYPYGYRRMEIRTFFTIVPNLFVICIGLVCIVLLFRYIRWFPPELLILVSFFAVYLGGTTLVSAVSRQFYVLIPIIMILAGYTIQHFVRIGPEENVK